MGRTATTPLPVGFGVRFDPDTRQLTESALFGGSPARVVRLSAAGRAALAELRSGTVGSRAAATLARRLTDAGLLHPCPPAVRGPVDATVVVPVRDRATMLDRCLRALGRSYPVVVVDDASRDPATVAAVARAHGATLVRRDRHGGAGAARNTGLSRVESDVVVMVDSDCVPPAGWVERLAAHLADPLVAVVAPRIVPAPTPAPAAAVCRYGAAGGSLDMGGREGLVAPGTRIPYVPTAALVVRRSALLDVQRDGNVFDPELTCGEDVDLVWRLHRAGWRIRYDPSVQVGHREPESWPALLARRFRYGTSAPQLARRHPTSIPPLVVSPLPALTVAALLAGRPALAGAGLLASVARMRRRLRRAGLPSDGSLPAVLRAVHQTWLGAGRYGLQFASPLLAVALAAPRLPGRRWRLRLAAASLVLGPGLDAWRSRRPALDPVRFTLASIADDVSYGAGVWYASVRHRTLTALRPAVARRPDRPNLTDRRTP
ncbi:MAG: mycofactocin biosynthesis glycosyltransferase MftF [Micromonosporaceae bacterium]|nr:mycofactocin biosynthesis glycosyltransferase MftF [Micromonosporaceae bacterium]